MKNILISIKPEHCCNILNKDKILEIRTSCPTEWKKYLDGKISIKPEPCKVYIYCTKAKTINKKLVRYKSPITKKYKFTIGYYGDRFDGRIVAEFILKKTNKFDYAGLEFYDMKDLVLEQSCLSNCELKSYIKDKIAYGWHIDNLIIYDKPKELDEFKVYDKTYDSVGAFGWAFSDEQKYTSLTRPPQSWCYVEEKGEEI